MLKRYLPNITVICILFLAIAYLTFSQDVCNVDRFESAFKTRVDTAEFRNMNKLFFVGTVFVDLFYSLLILNRLVYLSFKAFFTLISPVVLPQNFL
jgi:hypothetical protein